MEEFMAATKIGTICTSCRAGLKHLIEDEIPRSDGKRVALEQQPVSRPAIYRNRTPQQLGWWKRMRRILRKFRQRSAIMKQLDFHMVWRGDDGFDSSVTVANLDNPDFPHALIDLSCTLTWYDQNGQMWHRRVYPLPRNAVVTVSARECRTGLQPEAAKKILYGLVHAAFYPMRRRDARHWKAGSTRPYISYTKEGRRFTIHEKSLCFDTPRVVPGIDGRSFQTTILAIANIESKSGTVSVTARGRDKNETQTLRFAPSSAVLYPLPDTVSGTPVTEVEMLSDIAISGYQFFCNKKSGLIAVQHIVKEGN